MNIVNRDIKIDNIVASSFVPKEETFKLIDFSTSRLGEPGCVFYDCAGTPGFRAPEV